MGVWCLACCCCSCCAAPAAADPRRNRPRTDRVHRDTSRYMPVDRRVLSIGWFIAWRYAKYGIIDYGLIYLSALILLGSIICAKYHINFKYLNYPDPILLVRFKRNKNFLETHKSKEKSITALVFCKSFMFINDKPFFPFPIAIFIVFFSKHLQPVSKDSCSVIIC